jgi:hypothetical protein
MLSDVDKYEHAYIPAAVIIIVGRPRGMAAVLRDFSD